MSTITLCGQNGRTTKLLKRTVVYAGLRLWTLSWACFITNLCFLQAPSNGDFCDCTETAPDPCWECQVFSWCFPSPTLRSFPSPGRTAVCSQAGCSVCTVSKRGGSGVDMPFISRPGKELQTLPTAGLNFVSPIELAWSNSGYRGEKTD